VSWTSCPTSPRLTVPTRCASQATRCEPWLTNSDDGWMLSKGSSYDHARIEEISKMENFASHTVPITVTTIPPPHMVSLAVEQLLWLWYRWLYVECRVLMLGIESFLTNPSFGDGQIGILLFYTTEDVSFSKSVQVYSADPTAPSSLFSSAANMSPGNVYYHERLECRRYIQSFDPPIG
jgi:hypothetical protein